MSRENPSDKLDQYIVRMPDGMRDRIKAMAQANRRSMNAEILLAIDEHMAATGGEIGVLTPAAAPINHGIRSTADE